MKTNVLEAILFAPIDTFLIIELRFDIDFDGLCMVLYLFRSRSEYK